MLCLRSGIADRSHCAWGVALRRRSSIVERSDCAGVEPLRCETVTTVARCREWVIATIDLLLSTVKFRI
jgi:hypothetical protein